MTSRPSIRLLAIDRFDRPVPGAVEFVQQILGRSFAPREPLIQNIEIAALVAAGCVEPVAAGQTGAGHFETIGGKLANAAAADFGGEAKLRHLVAQLLALRGAPVLDHVPR